MHIAEAEHIDKPPLPIGIEPARGVKGGRVVVGPEQLVPNNQVPIVAAVLAVFVVNPVHLRSLKHVADPAGRGHVGVIEELAQRGARGVDRASFEVEPEHGVDKRASKHGVGNHLEGVLVERGNNLQPLR